jgi:hypothetical protein
MKHLLLTILFMSILLSACGPAATPTVNPADIQITAIAMAWTMAAETLAAIPTATPIPPTETPTATLPPTATLEFPATPGLFTQPTNTASSSNKKDPCTIPLPAYSGDRAKVVVVNETKGNVNLSLCADPTRKMTRGIVYVAPFGKTGTTLSLPLGCYHAFAWISSGKKNFTSGGNFCINNTDKWIMYIREGMIKLAAP